MLALWKALAPWWIYGGTALLVTLCATPLACVVARRTGVMDVPDKFLKPHAQPTPYLGGAAICLGWVAAALAAIAYADVDARAVMPILLGGVVLCGVGAVDDARHISPKLRLLIGAVIIGAALSASGIGTQMLVGLSAHLPAAGGSAPDAAPPLAGAVASVIIGTLVVLCTVNSMNLLDGLNGLAAGVSGLVAFGHLVLAGVLAAQEYSPSGDPARLTIAVSLCGATLGFLPFNWRGRIFMGDAGSILLGYINGVTILMFAEKGDLRWALGALVMFALPIYDTSLALFRRWRSGKPIFEGDRSHFYDQLVQRGLTVRQCVSACYVATLVFAVIGLLVIPWGFWKSLAAFAGVAVTVAVLSVATGFTTPEAIAGPRSSVLPDRD